MIINEKASKLFKFFVAIFVEVRFAVMVFVALLYDLATLSIIPSQVIIDSLRKLAKYSPVSGIHEAGFQIYSILHT